MFFALLVSFGCVHRAPVSDRVEAKQWPPVQYALPDDYTCRQVESVLLNELGSTFTGRCDGQFDFDDAPRVDTLRRQLEDHRDDLNTCYMSYYRAPGLLSYSVTIRLLVDAGVARVWTVSDTFTRSSTDYRVTYCAQAALQDLNYPDDVVNYEGDPPGYEVTYEFVHPKPYISTLPPPDTWHRDDVVVPGEPLIEGAEQ